MTSTGEVSRARWSELDERVLGSLAAAAGMVTSLASAFTIYDNIWPDWRIASTAGDLLLSGDLRVYSAMPEAQMGPLALLVAGLVPHPVYIVLVSALLPLFVGLAYRTTRMAPQLWHIPVVALLGFPWHRFAFTGHLDDALVLIGALGMAGALMRRHPSASIAWFALAIAAKPTAIMFLPLVLLASPVAAVAALAVAGVVYSPFVIADLHGFLAAGQGVVAVKPHSLPALLGADVWSPFPAWVRPVQLVGSLGLCWWIGRRAPLAAVAAVFAFRPIPEPGMYPAYCTSLMAACLVVDFARGRGPRLTVVAFVAWAASNWAALWGPASALRFVALGLIVALILGSVRPWRRIGHSRELSVDASVEEEPRVAVQA